MGLTVSVLPLRPVTIVMLTALSVVAPATVLASAPAAGAAVHPAMHPSRTLPAALRPVIYQALAKDAGTTYNINKAGCAELAKQRLKACFDARGAHFAGATPLTLHLVAYGRSGKLAVVHAVRTSIEGNEVNYRHGNLAAWWRVLPMGFEQGFTISKRQAGHGDLTFALAASRSDAGAPHANTLAWGKLRYGRLVVTDAQGKLVPSMLTSKGNRVLIAVDDAHAAYPLTVDPLVWTEQKVTASDGAARDAFGNSVAINGTTALVGASGVTVNGNAAQGAAYIFTESGGSWTQTQKLTANAGAIGDGFGKSVALVGTTALVGAPYAVDNDLSVGGNVGKGAVYVFTESGGSWTQTQKLTANDGAAGDAFGWSVALDGTTALVGALESLSVGDGAVYVFTESGASWAQTQKLTASDRLADAFGFSVALDGTTALVGASNSNTNDSFSEGTAYVFTESGGSWTQTQELTSNDGATDDAFGSSVALDATTALVGATKIGNDNQGAAYVFTESGGSWTQTQKLTASDGAAGDAFGSSVALDGTTALVGADGVTAYTNTFQGAAYVFSESGGSWTQAQKLAASNGAADDNFGISVALDGTSALVGADGATVNGNNAQGAASFYSASSGGPSDFALAVSAPQMVVQGENYVSQTIVTNKANADSAPVSTTMTVPAAASFVSATATQGSCSQTSGVVACNFGAIAANGGTATANVTLKASGAVGTTIVNTATIGGVSPPLTASAPTMIQASNSPPVAKDGSLTTDENTAASGTLAATDADGDTLSYSIVSQPSHGAVTITNAATGAYSYTPTNGYSGSDSFTFKANDGSADSNIATVSITVTAASSGGGGGGNGSGSSSGGGGGALGGLSLGLFGLLAFLRQRRKH